MNDASRPPARSLGRLLAVVVLGLALVVGAVACAQDQSLLVVNGWQLNRADFVDELKQIANNPGYLAARSQNGQPLQVFKDGSTTDFAPEFIVEFLNERVTFQLAEAEIAKRGLKVTDADRTKAIAVIDEGLAPTTTPPATTPGTTPGTTPATPAASTGSVPPGSTVAGSAVLDAFGSYREVLVTGVASLQVLQTALSTDVSTDEQLRTLYEQVKDKYANVTCARHILVRAGSAPAGAANATTPGTTPRTTPVSTDVEYAVARSKALELQAQLAAGADFATLATQVSDDAATKAKGGDLGCAPKGQYATGFDDALWSQPIGAVGDPVQSSYGYHLILVTDRHTKSFDEVKDTLRAAVTNQAQKALQSWLTSASRDATVILDPVYGSWNAATGVIDPPGTSTKVTLVPDDSGTTPGSVPAAPDPSTTTTPAPLVPGPSTTVAGG